jgi:type IV pilus assembly protein PilQ
LALANSDSLLYQKIDLSTGNMPLSELIRGIAKANRINIVVSPELNFNVATNFKQIAIIDVLSFLCNEHKLDIEIVGSIIKLFPKRPLPIFNDPIVLWNAETKLLKCDLTGDSLQNVAKKISKLSGVNILLPTELQGKMVWGYIENLPIEGALNGLALINKLEVKRVGDNVFSITESPMVTDGQGIGGRRQGDTGIRFVNIENVDKQKGTLTAYAKQTPIEDIVNQIVTRFDVGYVFSSKIDGNATFTVSNTNFEELLNALFVGTNFAYKKENGIYVFGVRSNLEIYEVRNVRLQYRTIENVETIIPNSLKTGVQITPVKDLNSFVISGNPPALDKIEQFLKKVDQIIPLIYIEVLIVDIHKSKNISTGVEAGLGDKPVATKGTILSGVDLTLSSSSVNNLINSFNGFGWVNLGKVTPQFYMSIKALEENGNIKVRSTPKLSTLNGHEATLTSGETKYYKEVYTNFFGSQIPQQSNSFTWKTVNADLKVTITPVVSGDDQITMAIEVTQSEFTPRDPADAPPGSITRSFKSLIRVKNEEMVILGGLEKNTSSNTSKGVPLLSRIPVIKWFFSSVDKSETDDKLSIFIKPIAIY